MPKLCESHVDFQILRTFKSELFKQTGSVETDHYMLRALRG